MSQGVPEIRVSQLRFDLESARGMPQAAAIQASIRPETREAIEKAIFGSRWLRVDLDVEVCEAVFKAAGDAGVRQWAQKAMRTGLHGPMLKPLVDAAAQVFGVTPSGWVQWMPRLWPTVYRNCGALTVASMTSKSFTIEYDGVPPVIADSAAYAVNLCASFEECLAFSKATGKIQLHRDSPSRFFFSATWL